MFNKLGLHFISKGYPKGLINYAYVRVKNLSQCVCLLQKTTKSPQKRVHFTTTFNIGIHRRFSKDTGIFCRVIHTQVPSYQTIHKSRTEGHQQSKAYWLPVDCDNILYKKTISTTEKGSFRCQHPTCICCREIQHKVKTFSSTHSRETFTINHHLTCQTSYVIYSQYVGWTIQKLHIRMSNHRGNFSVNQPPPIHPLLLSPYPNCPPPPFFTQSSNTTVTYLQTHFCDQMVSPLYASLLYIDIHNEYGSLRYIIKEI